MDFLRRLAPHSDGDTTRAVAALPSRFARQSPLRTTIGQAGAHRQAAPRAPDSGPHDQAAPSTRAPGEASDIDVADSRVFQDGPIAPSERVGAERPELQGLAEALGTAHGLQGVGAPPVQSRMALPLSESILAQRTLQSRDDRQEVYVTIGRIDVVASTAPAPAVRRSPTPRQGTVTLADYLRGGNGARR